MQCLHIFLILCKGTKKPKKMCRFFCFFLYLCRKIIDKAKKMTEINDYRKELKSKIINYAMGEFYKRGIRAVKMDEISRGLHVSKRTVYEIFGDKEELLLAGLKLKSQDMRSKMEEYARSGSHNVVDMLGYFYRLQLEVNRQVGEAFYEEIHRMPRVVEYLKDDHEKEHEDRTRFLEAGVREGLFRPDINYPVTLELMHIALKEIMHQQFYKKCSMQEIFDNFMLVVIRGICTERGLVLLNKALEQ